MRIICCLVLSTIFVVRGHAQCAGCGSGGGGGGTVTGVSASAPIASSGGTTPNISATYQGNGSKIQLATGSAINTAIATYDVNGNVVSSPCTISVGGTVTCASVALATLGVNVYSSTGPVFIGRAAPNIQTSDTGSQSIMFIRAIAANNELQIGAGGGPLNYAIYLQSSYDNGGAFTGTEALLLNPIGGPVGVGTINPTYGLDVQMPGSPVGTFRAYDSTPSTGYTLLVIQDGAAQSGSSFRVENNAETGYSLLVHGAVGSGIVLTDSSGACWKIVPTVTTGVLTSTSVICQ